MPEKYFHTQVRVLAPRNEPIERNLGRPEPPGKCTSHGPRTSIGSGKSATSILTVVDFWTESREGEICLEPISRPTGAIAG